MSQKQHRTLEECYCPFHQPQDQTQRSLTRLFLFCCLFLLLCPCGMSMGPRRRTGNHQALPLACCTEGAAAERRRGFVYSWYFVHGSTLQLSSHCDGMTGSCLLVQLSSNSLLQSAIGMHLSSHAFPSLPRSLVRV